MKFKTSFKTECNSEYLTKNLRNKFCKQLTPLLVRGVMAEFESFHWSRYFRMSMSSDYAWRRQLSTTNSHSISCLTQLTSCRESRPRYICVYSPTRLYCSTLTCHCLNISALSLRWISDPHPPPLLKVCNS